jgi:catechol 2,3-dioxygenase
METKATATKAPVMKFSHLGLVVKDLPMMEEFYTRMLGFELTDKGKTGQGVTMAFMTLDPDEHHQVFLVDGRPDDMPSNTIIPGGGPVLHHLSFRLGSLADLKSMHARLVVESGRGIRTVTHGVCWAMYTTDPEGNSLEFFADTPWYCNQPYLKPLDFHLPEDELYSLTEKMVRDEPGFCSHADFHRDLEQRVPRDLPEPVGD